MPAEPSLIAPPVDAPPGAYLARRYLACALALLLFTAAMVVLERSGLRRSWIAGAFLLLPVVLYATIGLACRTTEASQYFVAGRSVPAIYNGMAIGADWMSVASFMGLAGLLYANGFGGLAYVLGWTGGFCLIAFFIAPYLRQFGQYTIPDYLAARYGSNLPRVVGLFVIAGCSLMYVVAQIYGVGLITARLAGFGFEMGIFVGFGGILVCSFVGGMRAITWTQVAQYLILVMAFLVPVLWLSIKQTGVPLPQFALAQQLPKINARERELLADRREREVMAAFKAEADAYEQRLRNVEQSLTEQRAQLQRRIDAAAAQGGSSIAELRAARRALNELPKDADSARDAWARARDAALERARPLGGMPPQAELFGADDGADATARQGHQRSRLDFLALVFCLMAGTAGMPHILARFYTTPSVSAARRSVTWALLFIALLYVCAPVLAVLVKYEVLTAVVGAPFAQLPRWIVEWSKTEPSLVSVIDINHDGVLQLGELQITPDILVLAAPEIGGMPFAVSCLVAAGGLAAALSTADGLLLTIANALSHDLYFNMLHRGAPSARQVALSKVILLFVALVAAYIALQRPAGILLLVTPVFSIAAATIFPALALGIAWRRANLWGATAGMLSGFAVTVYYLLSRAPGAPDLWFGIQPEAAGVFGVPVAFATHVLVSLLTSFRRRAGPIEAPARQP
ncbi:MAG TPA: VC_2705 family sodium/solute symporter [Burkholderiaceae bacterium]|nr:VC_2705 family sodium/solute symporter [Burkholderiaceae bacterium]